MLTVTYDQCNIIPLINVKSVKNGTTFVGKVGAITGIFLKKDDRLVCIDKAYSWCNLDYAGGFDIADYEEVDVEITIRRRK